MRQLFGESEAAMAELLERVIDNIQDWLIIGDHQGRIVYVNETVLKDCLLKKEDVIGQNMYTFIGMETTDDKERVECMTTCYDYQHHKRYLKNQIFSVTGEKDCYRVCLAKDITHTQKLKEEVYKANSFDTLTDYPNHKSLYERIEEEIVKAGQKNEKFALIFLDIVKISQINNLYGTAIGDYMIKEAGKRIESSLGPTQKIYKYKGDIFALLFPQYVHMDEIKELLQRVEQSMQAPVLLKNKELQIKMNGAIAIWPEAATQTKDLINAVQVALVHAKKQYEGACVLYSKQVQEQENENLKMENDLQDAIKKDEFIVYYQPFVDLRKNKVVGMEALIRRQKKNGKIILPQYFIGLLEQMNLIERVGMNVLEKVCIQLRKWLEEGYEVVPVSVNLSAKQLKNPLLPEEIASVLERYDIDPAYVVLEITETAVMEDVAMAQKNINQLKKRGFAISIDDFGTGYASIGYLKKFMFDHLKIDISFIREIVENKKDRSIVKAITAIAKTLELTTIAEGIENQEQARIMTALGCEMGQGYYWDKPIAANEIEKKYLEIKC